MTSFKEKQLIRVINSIFRADNRSIKEIENITSKYISYSLFENAIKNLVYDVYIQFYHEKHDLFIYGIDMIRSISPNIFGSQKQILNYLNSLVDNKNM